MFNHHIDFDKGNKTQKKLNTEKNTYCYCKGPENFLLSWDIFFHNKVKPWGIGTGNLSLFKKKIFRS